MYQSFRKIMLLAGSLFCVLAFTACGTAEESAPVTEAPAPVELKSDAPDSLPPVDPDATQRPDPIQTSTEAAE